MYLTSRSLRPTALTYEKHRSVQHTCKAYLLQTQSYESGRWSRRALSALQGLHASGIGGHSHILLHRALQDVATARLMVRDASAPANTEAVRCTAGLTIAAQGAQLQSPSEHCIVS